MQSNQAPRSDEIAHSGLPGYWLLTSSSSLNEPSSPYDKINRAALVALKKQEVTVGAPPIPKLFSIMPEMNQIPVSG